MLALNISGGKKSTLFMRTNLMFNKIADLMNHTVSSATIEEIESDILNYNILGVPTANTRKNNCIYLKRIYCLDHKQPIFKLFRKLWDSSDEKTHPLLAFQMALTQDDLLRRSAELVRQSNGFVTNDDFRNLFIDGDEYRYSESTVKATVNNLKNAWQTAGLLAKDGTVNDIRLQPNNLIFALALSATEERSGARLFTSQWCKIFNKQTWELQKRAASITSLNYKECSGVIDIKLPSLQHNQSQAH